MEETAESNAAKSNRLVRILNWFARLPTVTKSVITTVEFGLAVGCIWAAWTAGGDMLLIIPALVLGLFFGIVGIATIPDLKWRSKFFCMALTSLLFVGIGGFLYWHFQPKAPDVPVVQKPNEAPKVSPSPQILSRLDHFIFACDVPPPDSETAVKFPQAKEEMKQRFAVWGDVVGMAITVTDIRGGFRIDAEASTEEAKRRLFVAGAASATKASISVRRIDQQIIVDVTSILAPIFGMMTPDPSSQDTLAIQGKVENWVRAAGKCHLL
jgi:prepilin signal peptidase PulO-like enzyme (type II secretory pathway)